MWKKLAVLTSVLVIMCCGAVCAQEPKVPNIIEEHHRSEAIKPKVDIFEKTAQSDVVDLLKLLCHQLDSVQKELKELKKQNKELQDAVEFLIEEDDDDEDDNPVRRLLDEVDEEMDEEDDEDDYRDWLRKRRDRHSFNQLPGVPHRNDNEVERAADLLGQLRENPSLVAEYEKSSDPMHRTAVGAYFDTLKYQRSSSVLVTSPSADGPDDL